MSSAHERNIRFYEAGYLNALKKGMGIQNEESTTNYDDSHQDNSSSSSDGEIQTRSKTAKKTLRRNERNARKQQQRHTATTKQHNITIVASEKQDSPVEKKQQQKKLTKRQQVLQRYADEEATAGVASVLASMADAAVTKSNMRNRNTVMWTEKDRASASLAADIALELSTEAAKAEEGKKKKEQPAPYWTRLHEKNRSSGRFQKEMGRVFECDFY